MGFLAFKGLDIKLAVQVTGVAGVVVSFYSKAFLENFLAGLNFLVGRTFVSGDCIRAQSVEGVLLFTGTVERVNPLRTVIRTDENFRMKIPNKMLSELMIAKELRLPTASFSDLETGKRIGASLTFTRDHVGKVDEMRKIVESLLDDFDEMDHEMPHGVSIGNQSNDEVTLEIYGSPQKQEKQDFSEFQLQLMQALSEGLKKHGIKDFELGF